MRRRMDKRGKRWRGKHFRKISEKTGRSVNNKKYNKRKRLVQEKGGKWGSEIRKGSTEERLKKKRATGEPNQWIGKESLQLKLSVYSLEKKLWQPSRSYPREEWSLLRLRVSSCASIGRLFQIIVGLQQKEKKKTSSVFFRGNQKQVRVCNGES